MEKDMRCLKYFFLLLICTFTVNADAGYELVCKGGQSIKNHKVVYVDCNNRKEFIDALGSAWKKLRDNRIGGHLENICWKAYKDARDLHPSISFANVSSSFLMRCNMGLEYAN